MIGTVIDDKYWIVKELGAGGAGTVYKAEQRELNRLVAIKVLHANKSAHTQLIKEAKNLLKVRSPYVVSVIAVGLIDKEQPYLVMEFLEGESLDTYIKRCEKLSEGKTIEIAIQVCLALEAAHRENIVHRDLKPANIMLCTDVSKKLVAKVLDFGLAKSLGQTQSMAATNTKTGGLVGTIAYMSPEVCSGKKADHYSDLYSFGCILYECISGHPPFQADNFVAVLHMHRDLEPPSLRDQCPDLTAETELLILKCLQKEPESRFSSAAELRTALEFLQSGRLAELADSGLLRQKTSSRPESKKSMSIIVPVLLVLAMIVCGTLMLKASQRHMDNSSARLPARAGLMPKSKKTHVEESAVRFASTNYRLQKLPRMVDAALDDFSKIPATIKEIDELNQKSNDPKVLAVTYQLKAKLLDAQDHFEQALQSFKLAYFNTKKAFGGKDSIESTNCLMGMLKCYYALRQNAHVESTIKQLLPLVETIQNSELPSTDLAIADEYHGMLYIWTEAVYETYLSYSAYLAKNGRIAESNRFAKKAIDVSTYLRPEPYLQLASNAAYEGNKKETQKWLDKIIHNTGLLAAEVEETKKNLAENRESEHVVNASYCYRAIGRWYTSQKRYTEAIHCYERAKAMADGSTYYQNMGFVKESNERIAELEKLLKQESGNH